MIRVVIMSVAFAAASMAKAAVPAFEVGMETLRIPAITAVEQGGTGEVREATILGKFYREDARPVIHAPDAVVNPHESPYALLAELLRIAPDGDVDATRALYSLQSGVVITALVADPEMRQRYVEWLKALRSLTLLGGWAEAPDRYVLYTRTNDAATGVMPFLFQQRDGLWYLYAGAIGSKLSTWLDAVYFSPAKPQIEIISPAAPEAVQALLAQEGMAAFAARLGVALPQDYLAK